MIGTVVSIKAMDAIFKRDTTTGKMMYQPESRCVTGIFGCLERETLTDYFRLLSCGVGVALMVGGLFMYGFTALRTHFIVVCDPLHMNEVLISCSPNHAAPYWHRNIHKRMHEHHVDHSTLQC